jgi:hypothetical protein
MKLFLLSVLFLLLSITHFPQQRENYLISIHLSEVNDLNKVEQVNLPLYYLFDDLLITGADEQKLSELMEFNIGYDIIDKSIEPTSYFLISPQKNHINPGYIDNLKAVFRNDAYSILKAPIDYDNIVSNGYSVAEIKNTGFLFKNEKQINVNSIEVVDTTIFNIVSLVNPDSVSYFVQSLQDFQTRFLFAENRDSVAGWIKSQFLRFGFTDVQLDSFQYQGTWQKNVVATLTGSLLPDNIYVFGGHHDSYSSGDPYTFAPGADDNASGTAAVLEIARVLMQSGYQPKSTIKFITFAAEEYGLWGSKHYADYALSQGLNIRLMINHDMISHTSSPLSNSNVDINRYTNSLAWGELAFNTVSLYSQLNPFYGSNNSSGSDSYSFYQRGYNAVYFEERDFSPYYHSPQDIITNYSMPFCSEVIKSSGALLLTAEKMPSEIKNYYLYDTGIGTSLSLSWSPNTEPDFAHYKIYAGQNSGIYDQTFITADTAYIVDNLIEGTNYFVAVSAINSDGLESFLIERNMTPYSVPLPPSNLTASPDWHSVELRWNRNNELDLIGYNLYRSDDSTNNFYKVNDNLIVDTLFYDINTLSGVKYYYYVKAQDVLLNESLESNIVASRSVSLDKGILLVDATANGAGGLLNPTDEQVDEFYNAILSEFTKKDFDISTEGEISLMELVPYSTVIWQKDDNQTAIYSQEIVGVIKEYLDFGGKLMFTGYRPSRLFGGSTGGGASYGPGSFLYDYFKIDSSLYRNAAKFNGAIQSDASYENIFVDSMKTSPVLEYHLLGIEGILPNQLANAVYLYSSSYDSTTSSGSMQGEIVGIEYLGTDHKSVVLSFPLYYMKLEQAKNLVEYVLINKFSEVTAVPDEDFIGVPSEFILKQNYPNPFNPSTKISWQTPVSGHQTLKIYDVLGNEITTLVDEYKTAGIYEVDFDASGLSSGVYFYSLSSGNFIQARKMILLR